MQSPNPLPLVPDRSSTVQEGGWVDMRQSDSHCESRSYLYITIYRYVKKKRWWWYSTPKSPGNYEFAGHSPCHVMWKTLFGPVKARSCIFYPKRTDMDAGPQTVSENERGGVAPLRQLPTLPKWPKLTLENTLQDAPRHQTQQEVLRLQAEPC